MHDQTCIPPITCILTVAMAWYGIIGFSKLSLPRHLTTRFERWKWKNNVLALIFTVIISIWCPLELNQSSVEDEQDNIVERFSCSSYYLLCVAWTNYLLDLVDLITHMRTSGQFRLAVLYVTAVAFLSVGIVRKSNVCLLVVAELLEISSVSIYLSMLLVKSGIPCNELVHWSLGRLRNGAIMGILSTVYLFNWFQRQKSQHRTDKVTTYY